MRKGEHPVTGMRVRELREDDLRTKDEKNTLLKPHPQRGLFFKNFPKSEVPQEEIWGGCQGKDDILAEIRKQNLPTNVPTALNGACGVVFGAAPLSPQELDVHRARHGAEKVDSFSIDGTDGKKTWVVTQGGTDAMYVNTALAHNKRGEWQFDHRHLNAVFLPMDIYGTDNQGKSVKEELLFLMFYNRPQPFHQGKETQGIAFYGEGSLRLFNRPRDPIAPHERHKISEKNFDQWLLNLRDVGCVSVDIQNKSHDLESPQERKRLWNQYQKSDGMEKDTLIGMIQKDFEAFKNIGEPQRPPNNASKKAFHAWFRAMAHTAYDRLTVHGTEYDLHLPAHRKALLELPNRHSAFAQIDRNFQERCDRLPDGIFSWKKTRASSNSRRLTGSAERTIPAPNTLGR